MDTFSFDIVTTRNKARVGIISTPHGQIRTPNFIPCGTKAVMRGITPKQLNDIGCDIFLSNTYHLNIFPGSEQVNKMGGLQKMTGWNKPMLTDSGGYQVFAMGHGSVSEEIKGKKKNKKTTLVNINEKGAKSMSDMGQIMGIVMNKFAGTVDGSIVQKIVKEELSK